jgi:hypothetical protein
MADSVEKLDSRARLKNFTLCGTRRSLQTGGTYRRHEIAAVELYLRPKALRMRNCPSHLYRAEIRFLFAFAFFNTIGRNSTTGRAPRIGHAGPIPLRRAPCRRSHDVLMCLFSLRILEYHFCPLGMTTGRGTHCRRGDQQSRSDCGGRRLIGKLKNNRGTTASSFR